MKKSWNFVSPEKWELWSVKMGMIRITFYHVLIDFLIFLISLLLFVC